VGELPVLGRRLNAADQLHRVVDVVAHDLQDGLHDKRLAAWHAQRGHHVVVIEALGSHVSDRFFCEVEHSFLLELKLLDDARQRERVPCACWRCNGPQETDRDVGLVGGVADLQQLHHVSLPQRACASKSRRQ